MNLELFIAKRIISVKSKITGNLSQPTGKTVAGNGGYISTRPIVNIATLSIATGITVMIIAIAIVTGFKAEIRGKVIGFGSHIQITNYDYNSSLESSPVDKKQPF